MARFLGTLALWIGIGLFWVVGPFWGFSPGCSMGLSFLGAMVFSPLFPFLSFLFLPVLGGSGVLSHGAVFGFFSFISSFFLCGHWDISEH